MVASIGLAAVGAGVAIVKPGDLGKDTATESADQVPTETSGDVDDPVVSDGGDDPVVSDDEGEGDDTTSSSTSSTSTSAPTTSVVDTTEDTTTTAPADTSGATSTTAAGSGFDADGSANPDDGLADTGGESAILAGAVLAAASVALRRRQRSV